MQTKKVDQQKEEYLEILLKGLDEYVFVKSIVSATGRVEHLNALVQDMEATIRISGEWDREDLKEVLRTLAIKRGLERDLEWKEFIEFSILRLLSKKEAEEVREAMKRLNLC